MLGEFINKCENSLTASVFSHLLHLPTELWWRLLRDACYSGQLPAVVGELRSVDFRPKWNPDGVVTGNTSYVEPDLFLRFAALDLIIEAKRWEDARQNPDQWKAQLRAYWNKYVRDQKLASAPKEVRIIALGGLWTIDDDKAEVLVPAFASAAGAAQVTPVACLVHMCRWGRLLAECRRMAREIERLRYPSSQVSAHLRILGHLIGLFESHDFQTGVWYEELLPLRPRFGQTLPFSQSVLHKLRSRFPSP